MTYQEQGTSMLRCVLVAEDGSETVLSVPRLSITPPARIRVPTVLGSAAVADVFTLSHTRGAPLEAVYTYVSTVPRSTDDVFSGYQEEHGPQLPG